MIMDVNLRQDLANLVDYWGGLAAANADDSDKLFEKGDTVNSARFRAASKAYKKCMNQLVDSLLADDPDILDDPSEFVNADLRAGNIILDANMKVMELYGDGNWYQTGDTFPVYPDRIDYPVRVIWRG